MNTLSWLVYLADIAYSLGFVLTFVVVASIIIAVARVVRVLVDDFGDGSETKEEASRSFRAALKIAIPTAVALVILPSSSTIYAIAASEYGEEVLKSPEASKARQALNKWLDEQLADDAK